MTDLYVDATTLISLGTIGELDHLRSFDGRVVVLPAIRDEVTSEPARTNLSRWIDEEETIESSFPGTTREVRRAQDLLGDSEVTPDVRLIAAVLSYLDPPEAVAVISDDRRLRTVSRGLNATVTGTIGVIVRAVEEGLPRDDAKSLVQQIDAHGLHMTAELRDAAYKLIEDAER